MGQLENIVADRLRTGHVIIQLAQTIVECATQLADRVADTGDALSEKFKTEGGFEFDFGTKDEFFKGLEERIGAPKPDILKAMFGDHINNVDSEIEWKTQNYGICTTSQTELLFVLGDLHKQLDTK